MARSPGTSRPTSGLKVAVVDKRGPAKGSTTASTALVQYEIDTPLIKLVRKIGKKHAVRARRRSRLALDALESRIEAELGIHVCGGRGKHSRRTPQELTLLGVRVGLDAQALTRATRLVAKVPCHRI